MKKKEKKFDLNSLRTWKRSQLRLLKVFTEHDIVTQQMMVDALNKPEKALNKEVENGKR